VLAVRAGLSGSVECEVVRTGLARPGRTLLAAVVDRRVAVAALEDVACFAHYAHAATAVLRTFVDLVRARTRVDFQVPGVARDALAGTRVADAVCDFSHTYIAVRSQSVAVSAFLADSGRLLLLVAFRDLRHTDILDQGVGFGARVAGA